MNLPAPLPAGARTSAAAQHGPTLADLAPGDHAAVRAVRAAGELRGRLMEMGFVSGTDVRVLRFAPLGDPMVVILHGYQLSLRRSEAETVLVSRD